MELTKKEKGIIRGLISNRIEHDFNNEDFGEYQQETDCLDSFEKRFNEIILMLRNLSKKIGGEEISLHPSSHDKYFP